jgi:DNA repair exonuclease SbcCD ATPase subunit
MSKIIKLTTENVKRISVVQITPDGNLVVIGGKNGQGKSSVLDSIMYALAGGDSLPSKPVRKGEDKAKVELDLGDLLVKRTFTAAGGTSLVVTNKDGVKYPTPQAMLDGLTGRLSFDPLDFAQQKPDEQSETLQALVGLDFKTQDAEIETIFNQRTIVNRDVKALQSRLVAAPEHKDVNGEEVSTADIIAQQTKASEQNAANERLRRVAAEKKHFAIITQNALGETDAEIKQLKDSLAAMETARVKQVERLQIEQSESVEAAKQCAELKDIDLSPFQEKARTVEATNRKIRENKAKAELRAQFTAKQKESEKLTEQIETLEKKKRAAVSGAKFPVEGLSLDDARNVIFNGIPFDQASTAEQLRVSVSIGLALNKNLRILLIRRGSDLDPDSLKLVADMAQEADAQVWLETSRTDAPVSVIMDDGRIAATEAKEEAQPQLV